MMGGQQHPYFVAPVGVPDRRATVGRHAVRLRRLDPSSPLQVGNGEFAFAVDPTGMQTFPGAYPVEGGGSLLGTMAQWGWHSLPAPRRYSLTETMRDYQTGSGRVPYVDLGGEAHDAADQTDAETWLRGNPHRLQLATIGLWTGAEAVDVDGLSDVDQVLDLWTGVITSRFDLAGANYRVTTAVHPNRDAVGLEVLGSGSAPVGIRLRFPYGSDAWANASDWTRPEMHTTRVQQYASGWTFTRRLDETVYTVVVHGRGSSLRRLSEHDVVLEAAGELRVVVEFVPGADDPPVTHDSSVQLAANGARAALDTPTVVAASEVAWEAFWSNGACVDLSGSREQRAHELERRIVLSQYLTAVNCAGSLPPAETGLLLNSWRGKFHLEMHLFHGAHFAAWGRPRLLARSIDWYRRVLGVARETAARQGHSGARWPKQVGPDGREAPSSIGPFLVWQQPHLIYLLEMLYRADPRSEVLDRHAELVHDTAEFMVSFAVEDAAGFHLGPPLVPAQESYASTRATARDPTFELAYWSWALTVACEWWRRLGRAPPSRWSEVANRMAPAHVVDGTYAALATPPYLVRDDHPSMLAAYGLVPQTDVIDAAVMARTYDSALAEWDWASTWGWDYPVAAMTAARLGRRHGTEGDAPGFRHVGAHGGVAAAAAVLAVNAVVAVDAVDAVDDVVAVDAVDAVGAVDAVDALLLDRPKNHYLVNGHNRQTERLPVYLPGNGGLLLAVAMMAGGWDGSESTPGFGDGWAVAHEGFVRMP